ncbi:MAG TPA: S53 family peptidase [Candidatus Paceibacterota bacterium]
MNAKDTLLSGITVATILFTGVGQAFAEPNLPESAIVHSQAVCAHQNSVNTVNCHARVVTNKGGQPQAGPLPSGYGPMQFHRAYTSATSSPNKQIIAIVDAYNNPNIEKDLSTYSKMYGIPQLPACSGVIAASPVPCFKKIDQRGGTAYPVTNTSWALEIALDVEVAHAMCQNCSILLVEADLATYDSLMAAVDQAVAQGATVISNSYGSNEFSTETGFDSHFNRPGIAITVSSGDSGYGAQYPASSPYVTAVGGTTLTFNADGTYAGERAWSGAGSGCSVFEAKPSWQTDTGCANRSVADVSAVADPSTGAAVYMSLRYQGKNGWFQVGGTSLAAPIIAGVYALAGDAASNTAPNSMPYSNTSLLRDIVVGSNGSCSGLYLCTAGIGYDGPTGLGTPNGLGAF